MHLLTFYLRHSKAALASAVLLGVVSGLATAALLAVINLVLRAGTWSRWTAISFALLCVLRLSSGVGAHVLLIRLAQGAIYRLRVDLCRRIVSTPLARLEAVGPHRLTACFTEDVMSVANTVVNLPYFLVNIVVLLGCLGYLGWLSPVMLLGIGVALLLGVLTYFGPVLRATRQLRAARSHQDALFERFRDVVEGIKELKLHEERCQAFLTGVLARAADDVRQSNVRGITTYGLAANWNRLLFFVYVGLLIFIFPTISAGGSAEPATLAGYVLVLLYMMAPLEAIQNTLPYLAQTSVALEKVHSLGLSLGSAGAEPARGSSLAIHWREITLRDISYTYSNGNEGFCLGPLSFSVARGSVVYITGGNGSGKTTLIKLLTGLYVPSRGQIEVDGVAIEETFRLSYRQCFSAVFADFHLFQELLGLETEVLHENAEIYLRALELDRNVTVQRGKLSTVQLSHGQRKRLALLTSLLEDRDIYVLDEWAADQDPAYREVFYRQIVPALKARGKTVFVVTHDDRYFALADRWIKLECGQIVADHIQPGYGTVVTNRTAAIFTGVS